MILGRRERSGGDRHCVSSLFKAVALADLLRTHPAPGVYTVEQPPTRLRNLFDVETDFQAK